MNADVASGGPPSVAQAFRGLRRLLLGLVLAAWALVAVGGTVRVSESGIGCPDWPLCGGRVVPAGRVEPVVEYTHRATAAVVIGLLLGATLWAWHRRREQPGVFWPLAIALGLVPVQALLGAVVVWLELPDRLVGVHFMVGMVMLGLCTIAWVRAWGVTPAVSRTFGRMAAAVGLAGLLLVSLGAGVVATDAMHACGEQWPGCNGGVASGGGLAVLQAVHRTTAYVVAGLAITLLVLGARGHGPRLISSLPAVASLVQIGFGIGIVVSTDGSVAHDVSRALHVAGAAALWVSIVTVVSAAVLAPERVGRGAAYVRDAPRAFAAGDSGIAS